MPKLIDYRNNKQEQKVIESLGDTFFQSEPISVVIFGHKYYIHPSFLSILVTHGVTNFGDVHNYTIETIQDVPKKVSDMIVRELYSGFTGSFFSQDLDNQLFYYIFCNKYVNADLVKIPSFPRQEMLERDLQEIVTFMNSNKQPMNLFSVLIKILYINIFKKCGMTNVHSASGHSPDELAPEIFNMISHYVHLLGYDIYKEFIEYRNITDDEILYYNLNFEGLPRYRESSQN